MGSRRVLGEEVRPSGFEGSGDEVSGLHPSSMVYMIVGPHSGYSLDEIFDMKAEEERRLGYFYWGYAGSLCHPPKVQDFAQESSKAYGGLPKLVMVATKSRYVSKTVGRISCWSKDGGIFHVLGEGVTLIGCTIAVVCKNLRRHDGILDLNRYLVANGRRTGAPLGWYIRYQVNKACAWRRSERESFLPSREVSVVAVADLVDPFCVYLAE